MKKRLCISTVICMIVAMMMSLTIYALDNGAYIAGRTTSYANPDTGETIDGGTNIALGDSMCDSIVDDNVLIEKTDDGMYVTVGIGLMSNISNVSMQVVDANGGLRDVAITNTGSCTRDNDTCNHYRFEMREDDRYFSPIVFVDPMGRDVQFFVSINYDSAEAGTGNFLSEMITSGETTDDTVEESSVSEESEPQETEISSSSQEKTSSKQEETSSLVDDTDNNDAKNEKSNNSTAIWIVVGVVVVAGLAAFVVIKKKGK